MLGDVAEVEPDGKPDKWALFQRDSAAFGGEKERGAAGSGNVASAGPGTFNHGVVGSSPTGLITNFNYLQLRQR